MTNDIDTDIWPPAADTKKRRSLNLRKYGFAAKSNALLNKVEKVIDSSKVLVKAKTKTASKSDPVSRTRSSFIGVTRSIQYWQALISINKRKTYIGSYTSEEAAALAFDFYCMLLHSFSAKTNFNYTK
mmetsp:Transcript_21246/g.24438  ORF Transcript_21246/g.24438 Transcript_21246/m.24438 type:complete len:128 (-) Transcript_21246:92-475(-)